ncbi:MAG: hypothetical protein DSY80_10705 [Desulfocapsa sp.]|nr:MAG: hypothetical protein DSY80_10705 [Desulfocapsa sp.]
MIFMSADGLLFRVGFLGLCCRLKTKKQAMGSLFFREWKWRRSGKIGYAGNFTQYLPALPTDSLYMSDIFGDFKPKTGRNGGMFMAQQYWTEDEVDLLEQALVVCGNDWVSISKLFPGRTLRAVRDKANSISGRKQRRNIKATSGHYHIFEQFSNSAMRRQDWLYIAKMRLVHPDAEKIMRKMECA